nr:PREDICTED: FBD-associated F-box protein At5g38590-like isoform X2 [Daucus carota subsp. sativus]
MSEGLGTRVFKNSETLSYEMASAVKKKKKATITIESQGEDRLSALPDELIHKIYSFLDTKEAVQASVLSKRWKLMWTTLPFISFGRYLESMDIFTIHALLNIPNYAMFIRHVLTNRNHQSNISELRMCVPARLTVPQSVSRKRFRGCVIQRFIQYAIDHNVECLDIALRYNHKARKLSPFSSKVLRELTLDMPLEVCPVEPDCWDLPALTTLHLKNGSRSMLHYWERGVHPKLPELWLTSLPALRTLQLDSWDISETSFSLPNLTSLRLCYCKISKMVWDLPALMNLHLDDSALPKNLSDMFSNLDSLKNLTLVILKSIQEVHIISCPQLLNLNIRISREPPNDAPHGMIVVSAPQLCNFSSFGIFLITFKAAEVENIDVKLKDWLKYVGPGDMQIYRQWFTCMLSGLGAAKNLSFDLESIQALAKHYDLASCSSPFYNLKCVKLPKEYRESSVPGFLRRYLLNGSPGATIVTSLPRTQTRAVSVAAENMVLPEPMAAPTKELGDCQNINEAVSSDTLDTGVREPYVMENSSDNANRSRQTNPALVGVSNDRASSSQGNKDIGLWQGHKVNSEFGCICLLGESRIEHRMVEKAPELYRTS